MIGGHSCQSASAGDRADLRQREEQILFGLQQFDPDLQLAMPGHEQHYGHSDLELTASSRSAPEGAAHLLTHARAVLSLTQVHHFTSLMACRLKPGSCRKALPPPVVFVGFGSGYQPAIALRQQRQYTLDGIHDAPCENYG